MEIRIAVLIVIALFLAALLATVVVVMARRSRLQFSLRTLLLGISLVAIAFSAMLSWDYLTTARTTWLDPASPEAARLVPEAVIVEKDGSYTATFTPRFRDMQELFAIMEKAQLPSGSRTAGYVGHDGQQIEFTTSERPPLEARLTLLKTNDVLMPGTFVIRGRVEDSEGRAVSKATVDLMGSYVYINHFQTREDGTFLMPIQPPPGRGYYLRIRYGDQAMNTGSFTLDPENPEMVVVVRVK